MKHLLSQEIVNNKRQEELDIAKAVLICCLAPVHMTIACCTEDMMAGGLPFLFDSVIGGTFGASLFMCTMGCGMVYTSKNTPRDYARRALSIAIAGYILNFFRFAVPMLIGYGITGEREHYLVPIVYWTLGNDILQFAPLAFLMIALFLTLGFSDHTMFIVSFLMNVVGQFFNGVDFSNRFLNIALGYFIGTVDEAGLVRSDFPLLNWLIVPVTGYLLGKMLMRLPEENKDAFYLRISPISIVIVTIYLIIRIPREKGMFGEGENAYYHISTPDVLICILAVFAVLGVYRLLMRVIPERGMHILHMISRNITEVYCIHWVLISFTVEVILYPRLGTTLIPYKWTMALSFVITVLAIMLADFWMPARSLKHIRRKNEKAKSDPENN